MVTKFGELIWKALQIETWCHLQQISAAGFNVNLSKVCLESVRSQSEPDVNQQISAAGFNVSLSEVCWEAVRSQSEVCQESVSSLMVTKFGELIWKALQIENWCHLQQVSAVGFNVSWFQSGVSQESVRSLL